MFQPFGPQNQPRNGSRNNFGKLFGNTGNTGNRGNSMLHQKRNRNGANNGTGNREMNQSRRNRNGNAGMNAGMNNAMNQLPNTTSVSGSPVLQSAPEEMLPVPMGIDSMNGSEENQNKTIYGDKHHFYIGSMIHRDYTGELAKIQKEVKSPEFQNPRWNIFHLRHIYLGYLDTRVAKEMMKKIFLPLCLAIGQSIGPIQCDYTKLMYRSKPPKNTGPKIISLGFKDKGAVLEKKIIPFLKKEGLRKIYNVESKQESPSVDLLYLNSPDDIYRQIAEMMRKRIRIPTRGFEINHLCLIKETPYARRGGIPSRYDRMNVESVKGYYYPLKGNKEEFNREYTRINQMRIENEEHEIPV
jgi:hypothetical protein